MQRHARLRPNDKLVKIIPVGKASLYAGQWREEQKLISSDELFGHGLAPLFRAQALRTKGGEDPGVSASLTPTQIYQKLTY